MIKFIKAVAYKFLWGLCYVMNLIDKSGIIKIIVLAIFIKFCEPFYLDYLAQVGNDPTIKLNLLLFGVVIGIMLEKADATFLKTKEGPTND